MLKTLLLRWLHALALTFQGAVGVITFGLWLPSVFSSRTMHLLLTHAQQQMRVQTEDREDRIEDLLDAEPIEQDL